MHNVGGLVSERRRFQLVLVKHLGRMHSWIADDEDATLNLLTDTTGARAAVAHLKEIVRLTGGA
jgi:hypothetical protein